MDNMYHIGYTPDTYSVKHPKFKVKSSHPSKDAAQEAIEAIRRRSPGGELQAYYEILTTDEVKARNEDAKRASALARAGTAAKNAAAGKAKKPSTPCPVCQATSRKLFSEMGGLQTRKCRNGHTFAYDTFGGGGRYTQTYNQFCRSQGR